jgi:hypothetical protein
VTTLERLGAITRFIADVREEVREADAAHGDYHSCHEGWAVIAEELDELWDEVKKKRKNRDHDNMYRECVQIASTALRFAVALCKKGSR